MHASADVSPYARRARGPGARGARARGRWSLHTHPGHNAIDVAEIETREGRPYTVFSPFHRRWLETGRRPVLDAPRALPPLPEGISAGEIPTLASLGLEQEVSDPARGGEAAARRALDRFLAGPVDGYAEAHDALAADRTSRLSPYLHFGCLSPRQIERRLRRRRGAARRSRASSAGATSTTTCSSTSRATPAREFQRALSRDDPLEPGASAPFEAWCEGRTGYPLVDAGMRQLRREGWMHNRARLVVGSFLTKDLGIDWRWGERWFMRLLLDGDEANNNGNWQWIASVGTDPQPAFRRIYNPARHQERYDPANEYVRRYVPELARVPDRYLREPWTMPDDAQRAAGCVIGRRLPRADRRPPGRARGGARALSRLRSAAMGGSSRDPVSNLIHSR